jgi:hypothetical protein
MKLLQDTSYFSLAKSYLTSLVKKKDTAAAEASVANTSGVTTVHESESADLSSMKRSSTEEGLKNINSLLMSLVGRCIICDN